MSGLQAVGGGCAPLPFHPQTPVASARPGSGRAGQLTAWNHRIPLPISMSLPECIQQHVCQRGNRENFGVGRRNKQESQEPRRRDGGRAHVSLPAASAARRAWRLVGRKWPSRADTPCEQSRAGERDNKQPPGNREVVLCELTVGAPLKKPKSDSRRRARPFTGSVDAFFVVSVCCRRARCAVERSLPAAHTACGDDDSL